MDFSKSFTTERFLKLLCDKCTPSFNNYFKIECLVHFDLS